MRIIGGKFKNRTLLSTASTCVRPSTSRVKETLMNTLQWVIPKARVLDLFSGIGSIGLEMLSWGAEHVTFIEQDITCFRTLNKNISRLGVKPQVTSIRGDVFSKILALLENSLPFDIIFADPPYAYTNDENYAFKLLTLLDQYPDFFLHTQFILEESSKDLEELCKFKHLKLDKRKKLGKIFLRFYSWGFSRHNSP